MCFSAAASFTASVALTGIGVLALRAAHTPGERMFALIPLLFAAQQATEGLVWMSYPWDAPTLRAWATQVYSVFSHLVWPVFIPWAVRALEPVPWRRHVLALLGVAGFLSALFLLFGMVATPILMVTETVVPEASWIGVWARVVQRRCAISSAAARSVSASRQCRHIKSASARRSASAISR